MFKNVVILSALLFVLGGCATAVPIVTPSGERGYSINCSVTNDIGECYKKAGDLCGQNGYVVVTQSNQGRTFWSPANEGLIVRCKAPKFVEKNSTSSPGGKENH